MHGQPVKTAAMIPLKVGSISTGHHLKAVCYNQHDSVLSGAMRLSSDRKANAMCIT